MRGWDLYNDRCLAFTEALEDASGAVATWKDLVERCNQLKEEFNDLDRLALDRHTTDFLLTAALAWPADEAVVSGLVERTLASDLSPFEWLQTAAQYVNWRRGRGLPTKDVLEERLRAQLQRMLSQIPGEDQGEAVRLARMFRDTES